MIRSMTGYGNSEGQLDGVSYSVEIRALNSRYFKTRVKLPDVVAFLEDDIEKLLRKELSRGTVNLVLQLKEIKPEVLFNIDEDALKMYLEKLSRIGSSVAIESTIDISGLLTLPGIIQPVSPVDKAAERIREKILNTTQDAIKKVKQMRAVEGDAIGCDLKENCEQMKLNLEQICARGELVLEVYQKRIQKRTDELLAESGLKLDEATLAREVAIFAERSDISEELSRLESHLKQFDQCCRSEEQIGRKLDFIAQEMLREANTIASKASDTEIISYVVEIKCCIDRIKEQVQNVE